MADDGLLLNFSAGDGIISTQRKFKGGKWKDRLIAKRVSLHHQKKAQDSASVSSKPGTTSPETSRFESNEGGRPYKRQRVDYDTGPKNPPNKSHGRPSQPQQRGRKEVISSLFSFNPAAKTADSGTKQTDDIEKQPKASNAPLVDGIDTFTSLGLSPILATHLLTKLDLKDPTAIQRTAIPQLLEAESDAFVQAQTGSGKTLAYLLPLVERLMKLSHSKRSADDPKHAGSSTATATNTIHRDSGLFAIILAPTRELCKQISVVLDGLLRCAHWLVASIVIGGEKKKSEKARLRRGLNILVATPGRLADHLSNTRVLDVSRVRWLVLDEGDRLMELGFEEEIQNIIKKLDSSQHPSPGIENLPRRRATILCSATLKMNVQRLGEMSLKDAIHIEADPESGKGDGSSDGENTQNTQEFLAPAQLKQSYAIVAPKLRLVALTALLKRTFARKGTVMKAIIFVSCADSVDFHFKVFNREVQNVATEAGKEREDESSTPADSNTKSAAASASTQDTIAKSPVLSNPSNSVMVHKLHGSLPQHVRTATLAAFARQKDTSVLICTDVASRGLDVPNVDFVIEYDPAYSAEDHIHRIGRTARVGRDGHALIFLLPGNEEGYIEVLNRGYRDGNGKTVIRKDVNEILKRGFGGNTSATSSNWEEAATDWQLDIERWALNNPAILEMARRAFQSHVRAYATHIAREREMFNIRDLHLGHLAKCFGLRDKPTNINVPGLRASKEETKKSFKANRTVGGAKGENTKSSSLSSDARTAAQKMRAKMKEQMSGASEFNIA